MQPNRVVNQRSTNFRLLLLGGLPLLIAFLLMPPLYAQETAFPRFRHADPGARALPPLPKLTVRLLVSGDYAPFDFQGNDGLIKGVAVDLARAACTEMRLTCELTIKPYGELLTTLGKGEGDLIVTPLKLNSLLLRQNTATRPYYVSSGQFLVKKDSKIARPGKRDFAGLRIGAIANSAHGAFLKANYVQFNLQEFPTEQALFEALQSGAINAAFGDTLHFSFWLHGPGSSCCKPLAAPFVDRQTFSRGAVFIAAKQRQNLVDAFDVTLDSLEANGTTAEIFARYVNGPLW